MEIRELLALVHQADDAMDKEGVGPGLEPVIKYLQSQYNLSQERVFPGQKAIRVLDIMVAKLEDGDTNLSGLGAFRKVLLELEAMATSMEFDCPTCRHNLLMTGQAGYVKIPQLTLEFDEEVGEAGSILSSWPILVGTCEYPIMEAGEKAIWRGYRHDRLPRNHADHINKQNEDGDFTGDFTGDMERILGEYGGRRKLAEYLGVR